MILNSEVKFPLNQSISYEAKNLIKRLLNKDPKNRIGSY